jgi:hypothetical protein
MYTDQHSASAVSPSVTVTVRLYMCMRLFRLGPGPLFRVGMTDCLDDFHRDAPAIKEAMKTGSKGKHLSGPERTKRFELRVLAKRCDFKPGPGPAMEEGRPRSSPIFMLIPNICKGHVRGSKRNEIDLGPNKSKTPSSKSPTRIQVQTGKSPCPESKRRHFPNQKPTITC